MIAQSLVQRREKTSGAFNRLIGKKQKGWEMGI